MTPNEKQIRRIGVIEQWHEFMGQEGVISDYFAMMKKYGFTTTDMVEATSVLHEMAKLIQEDKT